MRLPSMAWHGGCDAERSPAPISHISRFAAYAAPGEGDSREEVFNGRTGALVPARAGIARDHALQWLALVDPPAGIVLPPALWMPAVRVSGLKVHQVKRLARRAAAAGDPPCRVVRGALGAAGRRTPRGPTDLCPRQDGELAAQAGPAVEADRIRLRLLGEGQRSRGPARRRRSIASGWRTAARSPGPGWRTSAGSAASRGRASRARSAMRRPARRG